LSEAGPETSRVFPAAKVMFAMVRLVHERSLHI